jgi:hypothetical protein
MDAENLLIAAIAAANAVGKAQAAVFAAPRAASLIPALQSAMIAARAARKTYEAASGRVFDYHDAVSAKLHLRAEAAEVRAI